MTVSPISKAWRVLADEGPAGFARAVKRNVYQRHRSVWFHLLLDDSVQVVTPRFDGWLDFDHPQRIIDWIATGNWPGTNDQKEIAGMQERGQYFVGVMDGETIIGYMKLGWDVCYVLDYDTDIKLTPGDYFVIDIFIDPVHRGKGAGPFLSSASALAMKERGFTRSVMHVRTDKAPMLASAARAGYDEIGRVDFIEFLGHKHFSIHPETLIRQSV